MSAADTQALEEALEKQARLAAEITALRTRIESAADSNASPAKKQKTEPAFRFSKLLTSIKPSGTVMVFNKVKQMQAAGEKIVSLCVGEPDYPAPKEVLAATKDAVDKGMYRYTSVVGTVELREAICADLKRRKKVEYGTDEIMVSVGAKQAVFVAVLALCGPGDLVMTFAPYYVSYTEIAVMAGAEAVTVPTTPESGFEVSPEQLAQALKENPRTKMIILCNPSNPTGSVMSAELLTQYAEVLQRPENRHVLVLMDDIYEALAYDTEHGCMAAVPGMNSRCITVNGFSKSYGMTGYRLGYLAADSQIVKACAKLQGQINTCASAICQHAAVTALQTPDSWMSDMVATMRKKRDMVVAALRAMPGVKVPVVPQGAFYVMPDVSANYGKKTAAGAIINGSTDLCLHLLADYSTALVPGIAFGFDGGIRVAYATDMETLTEAMSRLHKCLAALS